MSNTLIAINLDFMVDKDCVNMIDGFHKKSEFCAGHRDEGMDSCQGDSGNPLVCYDFKKKPVLTGVVS